MKKFFLIAVPIAVAVGIGVVYFLPGPSGILSGGGDVQLETGVTNEEARQEWTSSGNAVIYGKARVSGAYPDLTKVKVALYDPKTKKEVASANLDSSGSYEFRVNEGEYILDIAKGSKGKSPHLPTQVYAGTTEALELNFKLE